MIGLLLPAVQRVREAANRAQCVNNLHQIALAVRTFEINGDGHPPSTLQQLAHPVISSAIASRKAGGFNIIYTSNITDGTFVATATSFLTGLGSRYAFGDGSDSWAAIDGGVILDYVLGGALQCQRDVTSQIHVTTDTPTKNGQIYKQGIVIKNASAQSVARPIEVVLPYLNTEVSMINGDGSTFCYSNQRPFVLFQVAQLVANGSLDFTLVSNVPTGNLNFLKVTP